MNKTAEEILQEHRAKDETAPHWITNKHAIAAMKAYGKQSAEQHLRNSIKTLNEDSSVKTFLWDNDIAIMASTPILTP